MHVHYCRGAPDTLKYSIMLADRMVNFEVSKSRKQAKYQDLLISDSHFMSAEAHQ